MKRPSIQFYPADWLRDTALRSCSVGARGLWIDMLCYMHEGTPYGHLAIGGRPVDSKILSRMTGASPKSTKKWLEELKAADVFGITEDGVIFSRRMIKDEHIRATRAESGKLGGNPNLVKQNPTTKVKQKPTPSSSSSSSSSSSIREGEGERGSPTPAQVAQGFFDKGESYEITLKYLEQQNVPRPAAEAELGRFIDYWTEPTKTGHKQRWQTEKTFEVRRRLTTWLSRTKDFKARGSPVWAQERDDFHRQQQEAREKFLTQNQHV